MIETFKSRVFRVFHKYSLPRWLVLLIDMLVVYFAFIIAYILRFNFEFNTYEIPLSFTQAFFVLAVYTLFMLIFKSYSGMIRHTTLKDTYKIIFSGISALTVLFVITLLSRHYSWKPFYNIPLSILVIHFGAVTVFLFFSGFL